MPFASMRGEATKGEFMSLSRWYFLVVLLVVAAITVPVSSSMALLGPGLRLFDSGIRSGAGWHPPNPRGVKIVVRASMASNPRVILASHIAVQQLARCSQEISHPRQRCGRSRPSSARHSKPTFSPLVTGSHDCGMLDRPSGKRAPLRTGRSELSCCWFASL